LFQDFIIKHKSKKIVQRFLHSGTPAGTQALAGETAVS
jgi:hypothetical protein